MATLKAVRQRCLQLAPAALGRVVAVSTIDTRWLTVASLATGLVEAGKYRERWMLRADATAAADRLRLCSNFNSRAGLFEHEGEDYSDTTATDEQLELHEYEPWMLEEAINEALRSLRYVDTSYLQTRGDGRYDLTQLSWIANPDSVLRVGRKATPVLTPNRRMEQWPTVETDGSLRPDSFVLTGTGATFARSSTARRGPYSLSVVRATVDAWASLVIPVIYSSAPGDNLRARALVAVGMARSAVASGAHMRVDSEDGSATVLSTTNGTGHSGGGSWEELTATHTIHASAEQVRITGVVASGTVLWDEIYGHLGALTDDARADRTKPSWYEGPNRYEQGPLTLLGPQEIGAQLVIQSQRYYPPFDATRVRAGTADADVTDCPLDLLAYKALAVFFAARYEETKNAGFREQAARHDGYAAPLQRAHLAVERNEAQPGTSLVSGRAYGVRARGV